MLRSVLSQPGEKAGKGNYRFKQLHEIEAEIPWDELVSIIEPHFQASSIGHILVSSETMLRIYFLQLRYGMSAAGVEAALFQVASLRNFALIEIDSGLIPNDSCIEKYNQLIKSQELEAELENYFDFMPLVFG